MIGWAKRHVWPLIVDTLTEWIEDGGSTVSAAMAYYVAFSFFPFVLVLFSGLGYVLRLSGDAQGVKQQILEVLALNTSASLASQVSTMLRIIEENAGISGPIGAAGLLIGALGVFEQLDNTFDHIWDLPTPQSAGIVDSVQRLLHGRLKAFLVLLGLGVVMILAFIGGFILLTMQQFTPNVEGIWIGWSVVHIAFNISVYTIVFTLIYSSIPRIPVHWRDALPGALLAAVIWEIGRQVLAAVLVSNRYSLTYGIVGSFIALMLWIYYASMVLFLGAEFVHVYCKHRKRAPGQATAEQAQQTAAPAPGPPAPAALPALPPSNKARAAYAAYAAYAAGGVIVGIVGGLLAIPIALAIFFMRVLRRR